MRTRDERAFDLVDEHEGRFVSFAALMNALAIEPAAWRQKVEEQLRADMMIGARTAKAALMDRAEERLLENHHAKDLSELQPNILEGVLQSHREKGYLGGIEAVAEDPDQLWRLASSRTG